MWTIKYIRRINYWLTQLDKRVLTSDEENFVTKRLQRALNYFMTKKGNEFPTLICQLCLILVETVKKFHPEFPSNRARIVCIRKKLYQHDKELLSSLKWRSKK